MKHKTWFRLVLKAIGVLMLCLGLPELLGHVSQLSYLMNFDSPYGSGGAAWTDVLQWSLPVYVSSLLQTGAGFYLLFGGKWIVDKVIPSNRPYCPNCGYPLSDGHGAHCPECGVALPRDEPRAESAEGE